MQSENFVEIKIECSRAGQPSRASHRQALAGDEDTAAALEATLAAALAKAVGGAGCCRAEAVLAQTLCLVLRRPRDHTERSRAALEAADAYSRELSRYPRP